MILEAQVPPALCGGVTANSVNPVGGTRSGTPSGKAFEDEAQGRGEDVQGSSRGSRTDSMSRGLGWTAGRTRCGPHGAQSPEWALLVGLKARQWPLGPMQRGV